MNMHLLANKPLDEVAMDALREFAPRDGKPYWLAYSGGKDSDNILDLTKRSGVLFEAHYSYIVLDPPELRRHIREMMRDPTNHLTIDLPLRSIVSMAHEKQFLPRRSARWCCELMKEGRSPPDRTVITGVRWAESNRQRSRGLFEQRRSGRGKCVNPIIGWETSDVWTYIRERGLPYSELYDQDMKRVGCVLCPLARNGRPDDSDRHSFDGKHKERTPWTNFAERRKIAGRRRNGLRPPSPPGSKRSMTSSPLAAFVGRRTTRSLPRWSRAVFRPTALERDVANCSMRA
jgi:3'-phosphoadenosine 5'-phosphosulfate sulfotransferase (PAPS reductase)/FAD synthetase